MSLERRTLTSQPKADSILDQIKVLLTKLEPQDLANVRHELDRLRPVDLASLDLAAELALQFQQAKDLLNEVQNDVTCPANQKASIFGVVRKQLSDIVEQQETVWSMERLKKFETAVTKAAVMLPKEARAEFFRVYGEYLQDPEAPDEPVPA